MAVNGVTTKGFITDGRDDIQTDLIGWLDTSSYYNIFSRFPLIRKDVEDSVVEENIESIKTGITSVVSECKRLIDFSVDLLSSINEVTAALDAESSRLRSEATDAEADQLEADANIIFAEFSTTIEDTYTDLDTNVDDRIAAIDNTFAAQNFSSLISNFSKWDSACSNAGTVELLQGMSNATDSSLLTASSVIEAGNADSTINALYGEDIETKVSNVKSAFDSNISTLQTYLDDADYTTLYSYITSLEGLLE